jgi:polyhydroxyalkanoate synthase
MSNATPGFLDSAATLDVLLVDAALGPLHRFLPDMSAARWGVSLARSPGMTARRLTELGAEAGRILTGTSTVAPHRRDRRFTDVAWTENPLLKRLVQLYLAGRHTAEQLVIEADLHPRDRERVRFLVENVAEAPPATSRWSTRPRPKRSSTPRG